MWGALAGLVAVAAIMEITVAIICLGFQMPFLAAMWCLIAMVHLGLYGVCDRKAKALESSTGKGQQTGS